MTVQEMHEYGYTWDGMKPLDKEEAYRTFFGGHAVWMLYGDNTDGIAETFSDMESHANLGGIFGIERTKDDDDMREYEVEFSTTFTVWATDEEDALDKATTEFGLHPDGYNIYINGHQYN